MDDDNRNDTSVKEMEIAENTLEASENELDKLVTLAEKTSDSIHKKHHELESIQHRALGYLGVIIIYIFIVMNLFVKSGFEEKRFVSFIPNNNLGIGLIILGVIIFAYIIISKNRMWQRLLAELRSDLHIMSELLDILEPIREKIKLGASKKNADFSGVYYELRLSRISFSSDGLYEKYMDKAHKKRDR